MVLYAWMSTITFVVVILLVCGCVEKQQTPTLNASEKEDSFYDGRELTSIDEQRNNAIKGTQFINKETYTLQVTGMVNRSLNLTYEELLALPVADRFVRMDCVEGWGFDARWTGVTLNSIFNDSGLQPGAENVIFYCADGYSTSLELDYLREKDIMLAYRLNNVTLTSDRGFPLQLVAEGRYGYKWAKWITHIEVTDQPYAGFWESRGYSNVAIVGERAYEFF
ncbi:MAG: molybdopterin-dependent oxidoreductase [Methanomethylovorans sp.]|nr:molybdopterin-dependent oxidoreductase [Methanomethylovorans sp.]